MKYWAISEAGELEQRADRVEPLWLSISLGIGLAVTVYSMWLLFWALVP